MLRGCLYVGGLLAVITGVALLASGQTVPGAIELVVTGVVLVLALAFERWRYRPKVNRAAGPWERTGEKFIDPTSGHLIEVLYNPETGERDYVDTGRAD